MLRVHLAVPAAAAALFAALLVPAVSTAAAGDPTCNGKQATIVGEPGADEVRGTEGDDVIVATDTNLVFGLAGDDTICTSGVVSRENGVIAGDGDDFIDATGVDSLNFFAGLGGGADTFIGSPGKDEVAAGDQDGEDVDRDVIRTAGGNDEVRSGSPVAPNRDVIDLGAGDDAITWWGRPGGVASVRGGPGAQDLLTMSGPEGPAIGGTWVVDNRARRARVHGAVALAWSGIESFWLDLGDRSQVTFVGSRAAEHLTSTHPVAAVMGGGDDVITIYGVVGRRLIGGGGRDELQLLWRTRPANALLTVDLAAHRAVLGRGPAFRISAEDLLLDGRRVRVVGDDGPNRIDVNKARRSLVDGRGGADRLYGGGGVDRLIGGPGRDRADGAGGRDRCSAEVRLRCEAR